MKQAKDLGINPQIFAFSVGPALPDFVNSLGSDANFVVTGSQWSNAVKYNGDDYWKTAQAYNDAYKAKYNEEPAYQAAESTACGLAFEKAIIAAGSLNPDKVRDALAKLNIKTFYGPVNLRRPRRQRHQGDGGGADPGRQARDDLAGGRRQRQGRLALAGVGQALGSESLHPSCAVGWRAIRDSGCDHACGTAPVGDVPGTARTRSPSPPGGEG